MSSKRAQGAPKCLACGVSAYPQELVSYNKQLYHEDCFKCSQCRSNLSLTHVAKINNKLYCQNCFLRLPPKLRTPGRLNNNRDRGAERKKYRPKKIQEKKEESSFFFPQSVTVTPPSSVPLLSIFDLNERELSEGHQLLKEGLLKFLSSLPDAGRVGVEWNELVHYLQRLGLPENKIPAYILPPITTLESTPVKRPPPRPEVEIDDNYDNLHQLLAPERKVVKIKSDEDWEEEDEKPLEPKSDNKPDNKAPTSDDTLAPLGGGGGFNRDRRRGGGGEAGSLRGSARSGLPGLNESDNDRPLSPRGGDTLGGLPQISASRGRRGGAAGPIDTSFGSNSMGAQEPSSPKSPSEFGGLPVLAVTRPRGSSRAGTSGRGAGGGSGPPGAQRKRAPSIVEYAMGKKGGPDEEVDETARAARLETVEKFLEAIQVMSAQLEPHEAADRIIGETSKLLMCERTTLFYVDPEADELILTLGSGAKNIRLPRAKGVAGYVATKGEVLSVKDPYSDPRFDPSFDEKLGMTTRNVMAAPIIDPETSEVIAVLQCINKMLVPNFSDEDAILLQNIATHSAIVLRNSQLYIQATRAEQKINSLLELVQMLHSQPNITSLIFTLSARAHQLVNADRCTLYLCDRTRNPHQLVVMQGEVDIRLPLSKGIAGHVATTGEIVNIPDCYKDDRFNKSVDIKTGYRTKSMLCMPIFGDDGKDKEVLGVLQFLNKLDEDAFGPEDENILAVLLKIAGPIMKNSFFFKKEKEALKKTNPLTEERPTFSPRMKSPNTTPRTKETFSNPFSSIAE